MIKKEAETTERLLVELRKSHEKNIKTDKVEVRRHREELRLIESEDGYRFLIDNSKEIILVLNIRGKIIFANKKTLENFGYSKEELIGKSITKFLSKGSIKKAIYALSQEFIGRPQPELEVQAKTKSGKIKHLRVAEGSAHIHKNRKLLGIMISASDVTERRREEAARAAVYKISEIANIEENLDDLFCTIHSIIGELMPASNFYIALYEPEKRMISFPYFVDKYDAPPSPKPLGQGLTEYVLLHGQALLANSQKILELEKAGAVKPLGTRSIDWLGVPLKIKEKTIGVMTIQSYTKRVYYTEADKDILVFVSNQVALTIERKRAEETLRESHELLRRSLCEKEALLREMHHRVKNNMQIISSFLRLQTDRIDDSVIKGIFQAAQGRIQTMALVHEMLYKAADLSKINFSDYIQKLAVHLLQFNLVQSGTIRLQMDLENVLFDIQTAIPCGLILNELITNTIKHAFPDGRIGELVLVLHSLDQGCYELIVKDDGAGIPPYIDLEKPKSFGWTVIRMLVEQIDGSIEIKREGGTEVRILFKEPFYTIRI